MWASPVSRPGMALVPRPTATRVKSRVWQPQASRSPFTSSVGRVNVLQRIPQRGSSHNVTVQASSQTIMKRVEGERSRVNALQRIPQRGSSRNVQANATTIMERVEGEQDLLERLAERMQGQPEPLEEASTVAARSPSAFKDAFVATRAMTRATLGGATRALTGSPGAAVRNLLLAFAAAKLAADGRDLEAFYTVGLIPVLQLVLGKADIGSWMALMSLTHRFAGVVTLALGPLTAVYFMVAGEASLPPAVIYSLLLIGIMNPLTGLPLLTKNFAKADMGMIRQFATGYQGALCAALHGLMVYTMPDEIAPQLLFLAFTIYHFVYAWGDAFMHAAKLASSGGSQFDESIKLETIAGGIKYPSNVFDMWRRAPPTPGSGTPLENILWRALVYNGEKEDRWTAAPTYVPTTAVAWTVSLPATAYLFIALSYLAHGGGPMAEYIHGLDYNFQGILATMSLLAVAQNNLGVFLYSLILHKKSPEPFGVMPVYGASWALFIAYAAAIAERYPAIFSDFLTYMLPLSQLPQ